MGKIRLVDFDKVGRVQQEDDDFIYYSTKNLNALRRLKMEGKSTGKIDGVPEAELTTNIRKNLDSVVTKDCLNDAFMKAVARHSTISEVIVENCDADFTIAGFKQTTPGRFTRDYSRVMLGDGSMGFTIHRPVWNESFPESFGYESDQHVLFTYAETQDEAPSEPLVVPKVDNLTMLCIVADDSIRVPQPWTKVHCGDKMRDILSIPSRELHRNYVMFNFMDLIGDGEWIEDEMLKKDFLSQDYFSWSYFWIDSSVKMVDDIGPLISFSIDSSKYFHFIQDPKCRTLMQALNECPEKAKSQFLKALTKTENFPAPSDYEACSPRLYDYESMLNTIPCLSDKFFSLSVTGSTDFWETCLLFPMIPTDIILSLIQFTYSYSSYSILPGQLTRGILTI